MRETMLEKLRSFFQNEDENLDIDSEGTPTGRDLHIATAVLLIEMAGSDNSIDRTEAEVICQTIHNEFKLPDKEVVELIETALAARKQSGKIDSFVKILNEHFSEGQRKKVLAMIWKVVLADGGLAKSEERFALQMKNRLRLSDEAFEEVKRASKSIHS